MTEQERRKILMQSSGAGTPAPQNTLGHRVSGDKLKSEVMAHSAANPNSQFQAPPGSRAEYVGTKVRQDPYEENKRMLESYQVLKDVGYDPNAEAFNLGNYERNSRQFQDGIANAAGVANPFYGNAQNDLVSQLQMRASGGMPSSAELQMQRGMQQGMAQNFALANSGTGNATANARNALRQNAAMQGDVMGQAGVLRAQEQAAAEQALGGQIGQGRAQGLQEQQVMNQLIQYYTNAGLQLDQAQMSAAIELEKMRQSGSLSQQAIAGDTQMPQGGSGWIGPALAAAGTIGGAIVAGPVGASVGGAAGGALGSQIR